MENPFETINQNINRLFYSVQQLSIQLEKQANPVPDPDNPIDIDEASAYLKISKAAIYQKIGKIPHCKREGKLYFFKSKLRAYVEVGERIE